MRDEGMDQFEKDLDREMHKHEVNRDKVLAENLNLTIANKALLETILVNQTQIFEHLFPAKTGEQHYEHFKGEYRANQAKVMAASITELTREEKLEDEKIEEEIGTSLIEFGNLIKRGEVKLSGLAKLAEQVENLKFEGLASLGQQIQNLRMRIPQDHPLWKMKGVDVELSNTRRNEH